MSRSKRKTPVFKYVDCSNKQSKRRCNRKFRRIAKECIISDKELPFKTDEVMTEWSFDGDGRRYIKKVSQKFMRK